MVTWTYGAVFTERAVDTGCQDWSRHLAFSNQAGRMLTG